LKTRKATDLRNPIIVVVMNPRLVLGARTNTLIDIMTAIGRSKGQDKRAPIDPTIVAVLKTVLEVKARMTIDGTNLPTIRTDQKAAVLAMEVKMVPPVRIATERIGIAVAQEITRASFLRVRETAARIGFLATVHHEKTIEAAHRKM
jgi:hypothetical protein